MQTQTNQATARKAPTLRFSEFSSDWNESKLGEVFQRITDKNGENNKNVLTISAQQGLINQEKFFTKSVSADDITGYYLLQNGDFAYNKSYSNGFPMGAIKRLKKYDKGVVSTLYICFRLKNSSNYATYFENYFDGGYINSEINKIAQEGARNHGLLNMSVTDFFEDIVLKHPDTKEQQKIASFLTAVDEWIENLRSQKQAVDIYKKGMMQKIFLQEIRFKDDKNKDFSGWEEMSLSDILVERKDRNSKGDLSEVFSVAKNMGVINQIEHLGRSYAATDLKGYKVVFPEDVIYTKSPTSDFPYGIIKQNKTGRVGLVSTLYAVFRPSNKYIGFLLHEYFLSWVNTYNYLNPLVHKGAKNTMNIGNSDFLKGAKIKLPSSPLEQQKIADFLISLDAIIQSKQKHLACAEQWKKGLMQQLFI